MASKVKVDKEEDALHQHQEHGQSASKDDEMTPAINPSHSPSKKPQASIKPPAPRSLPRLISRLHRLIDSRLGHDATLLFITDAVRLIALLLNWARTLSTLQHRRKRPGGPGSSSASRAALTLAARCGGVLSARYLDNVRAAVGVLDDWQVLTRLWGAVDGFMAAKEAFADDDGDADAGGSDRYHRISRRAVPVASAVSLALYTVFESNAWLAGKGVLSWSHSAQDKLLAWSGRSFGVFVLLDIYRLVNEYRSITSQPDAASASAAAAADDDDASHGPRETTEAKAQIKNELLSNLAWAPMALHWGTPEGVLSETASTFLQLVPSAIGIRQAWRETDDEGE